MDAEEFWRIYEEAGRRELYGLQVGMGISLYTTMRRGDVIELRSDRHIVDGFLRRTISKSEQKRGEGKGERLEWELKDHPMLDDLVAKGVEIGKANAWQDVDCPYLVSHLPDHKRLGRSKTHVSQVLGRRLQVMFDDARDGTGLYFNDPHPPTFHEIRSLGNVMYKRAGYADEEIQKVMAHSEIAMTHMYQDGHELPHDRIEMKLDKVALGGAF